MTQTEIQERIIQLEAEQQAMLFKTMAVGAVGNIIGLIYANKIGSKFWGKVGYFIAGGIITRLPMNLIYAKKMAQNDADLQNLRNQLQR